MNCKYVGCNKKIDVEHPVFKLVNGQYQIAILDNDGIQPNTKYYCSIECIKKDEKK